MLILQMMLGLMAAAQAAPEPSSEQVAPKAAAAEQARIAAEHCKARQFEAVITLEVDGKPKRSRIRMCGKQGQTDADWVRTLKDGAAKIAANPKMPQSAKDQALSAITAEIDKLMPESATPVLADTGGYSILPALPAPSKQERPASAEYSALPPLVPNTSVAPLPPAVLAVAAPAPRLPKPRLSVQCLTPGDLGTGGPCVTMERDTLITLRADDTVPAGTSLRFVRRGDIRAEVELAAMRKGQARRLKLPIDICAGGGGGRLDVEIARRTAASSAPQPVGALGRFELRC